MIYLGDFQAGATVHLKWNTNDADGASVTRATNGSIRIYKGSSTTQRSSANGITDTEDFDTDPLTGVHHLSIDLSDNTDAGFYAAGSDYQIVLVGAVIDGATVNACIGQFSIQNRAQVVVASLAAGSITASVIATGAVDADAIADGAIDAGALAADAITAAKVAADVWTEMAAALFDLADGIETGLTPRNALRLIAAACAGKASGMGTATGVFRSAVADSKNRITATQDANGNRSAITTDLT